jgi:CBS domain containing-hemolysin-like protein
MEIEITIAVVILIALVFLASVDMAFSHLSDVSLRRISSDEDVGEKKHSAEFLREIVENRPRFRFALSSAIQVLLICFTVMLTVIMSGYVEGKARVLLFSLLIGLAVTVLLRQIVPRLLIQNETERKLLFLLPAIRPIYAITSFFAEPITSGRRIRGN